MTTVAADPRPFDVCGELPTGVTVLEASAGTGKTFAIAALAARYVAAGTPLDQLLLVTFTRMATGELRERVRERLLSAEQGLARALAGEPPSERDPVLRVLADGSPDEVAARQDRLARALADFDAATIATTHGFCQEVLGGLGVAGDLEADVTFVEDDGPLLQEVVDDLYVRRFHWDANGPGFSRDEAMRIAELAVANPTARIEPQAAPERTRQAMRARLAEVVRKELERRKRAASIITYDDLLTRLADTLTGARGPACVARLRARHRVVLVDEFQDTDPMQWDIVRRTFGEGGGTLVLIGDPKQAIYAFRGADVYAYLDAAQTAGVQATLGVNWRSDQGLIDAYDALFGGAQLGHEGIVYRRVRAAGSHQSPRLRGAPDSSPLRVRVVHRDERAVALTQKGYANLDSAREHVAADVAADLRSLLSSAAEVEVTSKEGEARGGQPIRPGHVAVLVRTHKHAGLVRDALDEVGIPAVINGAGSVFATPPARDWLRLLEALERPASPSRAASAALTPFVGWTAEKLASAGEDERESLHRQLHGWAGVLRGKGVAALTETITLVEGLPARLLAAENGERELTDLRHVGQLLHSTSDNHRMGVTALTSWLRQRIAEAEQDTGDEERSRRLESDAEAVQVLTIHRSKGLEFPIVYCPFLWEATWIKPRQPLFFHDPDAHDERTIDVALEGADYARHARQHEIEQRGEDLRLAYVALTRAQNQAVVWWAGTYHSRHSPLSRLLFEKREGGEVASYGRYVPSDAEAVTRFEALAAAAPGCVSVARATIGAPGRWAGRRGEPGELSAARFDRRLDWAWRRTSYSAITAAGPEARVASEPEEPMVDDETPLVGLSGGAGGGEEGAAALRAVPSLLSAMPVGVQVGTFVHRVLEAADFAAADLDGELAGHVARMQARRHVDVGDPTAFVSGVRAAVETPLGPSVGGARLRDVSRADRLDELAFELPLVGGDEPTGHLTLQAIAEVLRRHLAADDPLAGYAERLNDPELQADLRGYLTGSIDLVVRVPDTQGVPRFAVVDYKTNWLAPPDETLSAWHHRPPALAAEMSRAHYGLQALLYTAALHRFLRWRLPGYDPERNLAGVLYLFVRGMIGAQTPVVDGTPCGVFSWEPPKGLVGELSDVLDRGAA